MWFSGRTSPCQGEGRRFDPGHPLSGHREYRNRDFVASSTCQGEGRPDAIGITRSQSENNMAHIMRFFMFYVYILRSLKTGRLYIGQTKNLTKRIERHQRGRCLATKAGRPYQLTAYEVYEFRSKAMQREQYLKSLKNPAAVLASLKK